MQLRQPGHFSFLVHGHNWVCLAQPLLLQRRQFGRVAGIQRRSFRSVLIAQGPLIQRVAGKPLSLCSRLQAARTAHSACSSSSSSSILRSNATGPGAGVRILAEDNSDFCASIFPPILKVYHSLPENATHHQMLPQPNCVINLRWAVCIASVARDFHSLRSASSRSMYRQFGGFGPFQSPRFWPVAFSQAA